MFKGWNYEWFSKSEVEEATGSPWVVDLCIDNAGFEVTIVRHQITYVRKRVRKLTSAQILERAEEVTL